MLSIYRIKTRCRKSSTNFGCLEWQYEKQKLTCFRYCSIQRRFIVIGFRWAGNSPFSFDTKESATKWGIKSLCGQKEEFILINNFGLS